MFLLAPFSWLYAFVMDIRNWMFTHGWLRETSFDIPIICMGNLAVGGTGKTPHTEWLVHHLVADGLRVATLSRGYGRKSKGYVEASATTTAHDIGDEPLQMFLHFQGRAVVAVCEDRCEGIRHLQQHHPDLDIIVLDDAYQHRYVRPTLRVLLTDYARPYYADHVLPWGRLREKRKGAARADVIIVTKCPATLTKHEQRTVSDHLAVMPHQRVFFSTTHYAELPVRPNDEKIAVVAGIAHPQPFIDHLLNEGFRIGDRLLFGDHHNFTDADLARIDAAAERTTHIVTTAKDHARLRNLPLREETKRKLVVQDISVQILNDSDNPLYPYIKNAYAYHH